MTQGPSEPRPPASREQVTRPRLDGPAGPPAHPPTERVSAHPPTEIVQPHEPTEADPRRQGAVPPNPTIIAPQAPPTAASSYERTTVPPANQPAPYRPDPPTVRAPAGAPPQPASGGAAPQPASEVLRYGPGVPPSQAGVSAEQVWRTGQMPDPPRRPVRLRRLASLAVTVILLAAAGVLLFLRFHHAPFQVTAVKIVSATTNGCSVNVTGLISTNGAAGTVPYEWVFTPQQQAPQPLSQSVVSGQHAAYVTVAVEGQGHGTATQKVTLQLLGPNQGTASTVVRVSC
jgi:hypothetical protein